jgi:uncharacterized integral membrane protein
MRARIALFVLLIVVIAGFAALNWPAFIAQTPLNLVFGVVEAPLGLIMLVALGAVVLIFSINMAIWQGSILLETRRYSKELQTQRNLADQAEASRFTELRSFIQSELSQLNQRVAQSHDVLRSEMKRELYENSNGLAATIAEIDDRLQRRAISGPN